MWVDSALKITGQRPQNSGAVGEELHRLIGPQPLRAQDLEHAPTRLGIDLLHEAEAFGAPFGGNAFARNHLETAFFMPVPDVAPVEADHQRAGRAWQGLAVTLTAALKGGHFCGQLLFLRLDHRVQVLLDGRAR
jgi:hypothetical protein